MFVKDLFDKYNVICPNWLEKNSLEDDLIDSDYSVEEGLHKWKFKNEFKDILLTFDGEEFHFKAFDDEGHLMLDNVYTKNYCMIC